MTSRKARWLLPFILAAALLAPAYSSASSFPSAWDGEIKSAVKNYWPAFPFWKAWKAQLYQESLLRPNAVSHVGARGLAQFMPGTWREVATELRLGTATPHDDIAVQAGAYYMAKLRKTWAARRTETDRHRLAQASYNAGAGNILKAQKRCGNRSAYPDIIACLPAVTGRHSKETIGYVVSIEKWWRRMELE